MRLLLDTHIFLWYITGDERISPRAPSCRGLRSRLLELV